MNARMISTRLHDFFLTMARKSFAELGLGDEAVVGYVAALMTEFARSDRLMLAGCSGGARDQPLVRSTETGRSLDRQSLVRARELQRAVGDYALFMSGLFRTHVEQTGSLDHVLEEGRRSYLAVSQLDLTLLRTGFLFFQELSKNFEFYSGALDYMRKAYFAPHPAHRPYADFLRHVRGWITRELSDN